MKKLIPLCTLIIAITACAENSDQVNEKFHQDAANKIKTLSNNLKKELSGAMQTGGPVAAINFCKAKAPEITQSLNSNGDLVIKRTSLKFRNPNNSPDTWEQQVLLSFEQQLAKGTPISELVHSEQIKSDKGTTLRLMRAIPVQGLCLTCHGDMQTMNKDLVNTLKESYPNDLATGYQVGELRGAFSITQTIEN